MLPTMVVAIAIGRPLFDQIAGVMGELVRWEIETITMLAPDPMLVAFPQTQPQEQPSNCTLKWSFEAANSVYNICKGIEKPPR